MPAVAFRKRPATATSPASDGIYPPPESLFNPLPPLIERLGVTDAQLDSASGIEGLPELLARVRRHLHAPGGRNNEESAEAGREAQA